jgi:hypothetical protein
VLFLDASGDQEIICAGSLGIRRTGAVPRAANWSNPDDKPSLVNGNLTLVE